MQALVKAREKSAECVASDVVSREDDSGVALAVAPGPVELAFVESSKSDQDTRLPTELLRHIFLETGAFVAVDQGDIFNLMAVCQRWHSVARSILPLLRSPIYRLPNKLLVRIFLFSFASLESCPHYSECLGWEQNSLALFGGGSIFDLMAVCHRWRSVVLSTPELWATFSVCLAEEDRFDEERSLNLKNVVDLHLERSGKQALALRVESGFWCQNISDLPEHPLWPKLVASSSRWKILEISVPNVESVAPSFIGIQLPNLEKLSISYGHYDPVDLNYIGPAPKLRSIHAGYFLLSVSNIALFQQVTALMISTSMCALLSGVRASFVRVLEKCPNLHTLVFRWRSLYAPPSDYRVPPISVPITQLKVLFEPTYYYSPSAMLSLSVALLTAPQLTSLIVQQDVYESEAPFSSAFSVLHDFLVRSNCALTVLVMRGVSLSDRQAVQILRLTPTLVELTVGDACRRPYSDLNLNHCPVSKHFIRSLHSYTSSPLHPSAVAGPLVPRLRLLHLHVRSVPFDYGAVIGTVSSRWFSDTLDGAQIGVERLRSVVLELSEEVNDVKAEPLIRLDRAGLRVVIKRMGY